jgi:hypothetical protein
MVRTLVLLFSLAAALWANGKGAVVFDVDFTKGLADMPAQGRVNGGEWRDGWRVTGRGQSIVLDAGYPIKNGVFELTVARADLSAGPVAFALPAWDRSAKVFGLYENAELAYAGAGPGDLFQWQVGSGERQREIQGVLRANTREQAKAWRWMQEYGKWSDWTNDDHTPLTVKFEWRDGKGVFTDFKGASWPCPKDCHAQMDSLRYVALGTDQSAQGSLGMRYLRARLTDLDKPEATQATRLRRQVVFDLDLTQGEDALPPQAVVLGGQWDNGWRVMANGQRLVLDPGYWIRNGSLEVTLTRKRGLIKGDKINVIGIYEDAAIDQADLHGDQFYLRLGMTEIGQAVQGNIKAFIRERVGEHYGMVWEERFGKADDWVLDDTTPKTVKFEWRNGAGTYTDVNGKTLACPDGCYGKLDRLRYVVLGGDRYDGGTVLTGTRFLRVKLTDFDQKP